MRRKDREVIDLDATRAIIKRCNTIRLGIHGDKYPYVVPVSFGYERVADRDIIYFHCAKDGFKVDLLQVNPNVCVEGDIFLKTERTRHGITARYESFMGFGTCELLDAPDAIQHGLQVMIDHYGYDDFPLEHCPGQQHIYIGRIVLESLTGKRNLPDE